MVCRWCVPEMHETGVVKQRRRLQARNMSTKLRRHLVGSQHDGHGVPADDRAYAMLDVTIAWMMNLPLHGYRVEVGCACRIRHRRAAPPRAIDQPVQQEVRALWALDLDPSVERIQPFSRFRLIDVVNFIHCLVLPLRHTLDSCGRPSARLWRRTHGNRPMAPGLSLACA